MFGLFKRKKDKSDPVLEMLREENERLDKILTEKQKETAKVEEEIAKAENALRALGYTDKDLERIAQKAKMKVIKKMRTDSGPLFFRDKFLCYNRKKGGAKR